MFVKRKFVGFLSVVNERTTGVKYYYCCTGELAGREGRNRSLKREGALISRSYARKPCTIGEITLSLAQAVSATVSRASGSSV